MNDNIRHICDKCGSAMIRADLYDPDGEIKLYGGYKRFVDDVLVEWWICINPSCEDGARNSMHRE